MGDPDSNTNQSRPSSARRWLKRIVKWLGVLILFALGLVLAVSIYFRIVGDDRLQKAIAEADRLDPDGWRWDEFLPKQEAMREEKNSALRIEAAAKLIPENWPVKESLLERIPDQEAVVQLSEEQIEELRAE